MKDAEYIKQRARVRAYIRDWHPRLAEGYTVTYDWYAARSDMPEDMQDAQLFARSKWAYQSASIGICCDGLENMSDRELEEAVVHELVHIRLAGMGAVKGRVSDREELTCTQVARAIIRTRDSERRRTK